ncbi:phosphopantetheine-binding protein [Streptomyces sp. NPDC001941]|uniref:phosphopantetheine-binding protein n=1 Tax=Streptomyces sp. NPDC001941 TaxID=3154659 RepID=UPI0033340DCE
MRTYINSLLTGPYQVPPPVAEDASLTQLGLDSLALAELAAELQDVLRVPVTGDDVTPHTTVTELATSLEAKGATVPR